MTLPVPLFTGNANAMSAVGSPLTVAQKAWKWSNRDSSSCHYSERKAFFDQVERWHVDKLAK